MNRKHRRELKRHARLHDGRVAVGLAPSSDSPAPASPPIPQSVPLREPEDRRTKQEIKETADRLAAKSAHRNRIAYANGFGVRAGLRESEPSFTWPWAESVAPLPQS